MHILLRPLQLDILWSLFRFGFTKIQCTDLVPLIGLRFYNHYSWYVILIVVHVYMNKVYKDPPTSSGMCTYSTLRD